MREISFRGKRIDNGQWVYGGFYKEPTNDIKSGFSYIVTSSLTFAGNAHAVIPETVGQFTGLTDKHGNKIFEGDVLQGDDIEDDVYYVVRIGQSDENRYECFLDFNGDNQCWLPFIDSFNRMKIIGNIHDNPELLGGK